MQCKHKGILWQTTYKKKNVMRYAWKKNDQNVHKQLPKVKDIVTYFHAKNLNALTHSTDKILSKV